MPFCSLLIVFLSKSNSFRNTIRGSKLFAFRLSAGFYSDLVECLSVFFDFSLTVKAAPHECVIRTGQP